MTKDHIKQHLADVFGQQPWRARLGWGSFLTFDFGPKVRKDNHYYGAWHLWIYQCAWSLESRVGEIANSESPRHLIDKAVRNLEKYPLRDVFLESSSDTTTFRFGENIRLKCFPYEDGESLAHNELWMFFLPQDKVLSVSPGGVVAVEQASTARPARVLQSGRSL